MSSLTSDQVALQLESLNGWQLDGSNLVKTYEFESFAEVMAFMVRVSFYCNELEHYPVWQNDYNLLHVRIGDAEQVEVQGRDVQLAKRMEASFK